MQPESEKDPIPVALDQPQEELRELITEDAFDSEFWKVARYIDSKIHSSITRPKEQPDGKWSAKDITPFLIEIMELVRQEIYAAANGYSSQRWLFYLRRLPEFVFKGRLITTSGYNSALAETISGFSSKSENGPQHIGGFYNYRVDSFVARRIMKFCALTQILSQIHVRLRYAGKDVAFGFTDEIVPNLPCQLPTQDQIEAIESYDQRVIEAYNHFPFTLHRTGTLVDLNRIESTNTDDQIFCVHRISECSFPVNIRKSHNNKMIIKAKFMPDIIDVSPLRTLVTEYKLRENAPNWSSDAAILLLLLRLAVGFWVDLEYFLVNVLKMGCLIISIDIWREVLYPRFNEGKDFVNSVFPEIYLPEDPESLLKELLKISGSDWPLIHGPIIRGEKNVLYIDLCAATECLSSSLELPPITGEPANVRSGHFELMTQRIIEKSTWNPSGGLTRLRGKTLKLEGRAITDIDAIGVKNNTLLIVSCKSIIYSSRYDQGDYNIVRNRATDVEKYVKEWQEKKTTFQDNAVGDNYDFSSFENIVAVVCTPQPVYVNLGIATNKVADNLLAAVSLGELKSWLEMGK